MVQQAQLLLGVHADVTVGHRVQLLRKHLARVPWACTVHSTELFARQLDTALNGHVSVPSQNARGCLPTRAPSRRDGGQVVVLQPALAAAQWFAWAWQLACLRTGCW